MSKPLYPIYNENNNLEPGLYLGLFHGFKNEKEREKAEGWGEQGAVIGPLKYVHTTYAAHVKIMFIRSWTARIYGLTGEDMLDIRNGMIEFDGMQYGDWTVFYHGG